MERQDFRSLGRQTQEALRFRAVFLVLQLHKTQAEAAEAVGVSRQVVNQWLRNYASDGEKALLDRRLNTHRKGKGRLTDAEARRVQQWIRDKCPQQLKLESPGFVHGSDSCSEAEVLHLVGVLTIDDEFREDSALGGIQEKFRQALA